MRCEALQTNCAVLKPGCGSEVNPIPKEGDAVRVRISGSFKLPHDGYDGVVRL